MWMSLYNGYFAQGFALDPSGTVKAPTQQEAIEYMFSPFGGKTRVPRPWDKDPQCDAISEFRDNNVYVDITYEGFTKKYNDGKIIKLENHGAISNEEGGVLPVDLIEGYYRVTTHLYYVLYRFQITKTHSWLIEETIGLDYSFVAEEDYCPCFDKYGTVYTLQGKITKKEEDEEFDYKFFRGPKGEVRRNVFNSF